MKELNSLVFDTIKADTTFKNNTGATSTDPRIYYVKTPVKHTVNSTKHSYAVFYLMGTTDPGNRIWSAGRNDHTYVVEIYSKKITTLSTLLQRIETLFRDQQLETTSYYIGNTSAYQTAETFDEARDMYFGTVMVLFRIIWEK